jgi:hypothetical protein
MHKRLLAAYKIAACRITLCSSEEWTAPPLVFLLSLLQKMREQSPISSASAIESERAMLRDDQPTASSSSVETSLLKCHQNESVPLASQKQVGPAQQDETPRTKQSRGFYQIILFCAAGKDHTRCRHLSLISLSVGSCGRAPCLLQSFEWERYLHLSDIMPVMSLRDFSFLHHRISRLDRCYSWNMLDTIPLALVAHKVSASRPH